MRQVNFGLGVGRVVVTNVAVGCVKRDLWQSGKICSFTDLVHVVLDSPMNPNKL